MLINQTQILNAKQRKQLLAQIKEQWDVAEKPLADLNKFVFLRSTNDKIYLINRDFQKLLEQKGEKKFRIDKVGMYFGLFGPREVRVNIEGSQLIGKNAKKNIIEVDDKQLNDWVTGNEIVLNEKQIRSSSSLSGFIIIKHKNKKTNKFDYFGSGLYREDFQTKEKKILNFVSKNRRVKL